MDDGGRRTGRTGLLKVKRPLNTDSLCGHYQCREKEAPALCRLLLILMIN